MRKPRHTSFYRTHARAHEAIINNEHWYGDNLPSVGKAFTAKKTAERHGDIIQVLLKAGSKAKKAKDTRLADAYDALADKFSGCKPGTRCGSLGCTKCARASQKAKAAAQEALIHVVKKDKSTKKLVMANVIPLWMTFLPDQLDQLEIQKRNRWLKDALRRAGFNRIMFGSADISWENGFYQLHWHIGMFTSNPKRLTERLKKVFPGNDKHDRPVVVSKTWSLGFLPYKNKAIKLPDLLRRNRTHLPQLLLVLDRTEPLDLMVLTKLRLSAQSGGLVLRPIGQRNQNTAYRKITEKAQ